MWNVIAIDPEALRAGCLMRRPRFPSAGRLGRLLRSEEGLTATEYAVMLALIIMVCISAARTLGTNVEKIFYLVGVKLR
jgi:pilus assembly protein Flp/PilA